MFIFLFISIFISINSFFLSNSSNYSKDIHYFLRGNPDAIGQKIIECLWGKEKNYTCALIIIRDNLDDAFVYLSDEIILNGIKIILNNDKANILINIVIESIHNKTGLLEYLYKSINITDNGINVLDYAINIINEIENPEQNNRYIIRNLSRIINHIYIKEVIDILYYNSSTNIINVIEFFVQNAHPYDEVYKVIKDNLFQYKDIIKDLLINLLISYENRNALVKIIANFLKYNKQIFPSLKKVFRDEYFRSLLKELLNYDDTFLNNIKDVLIENPEILNGFLDFAENEEVIDGGEELYINMKNSSYIMEKLPDYLAYLNGRNKKYIEDLMILFLQVFEKLYGKKQFLEYTIENLQSSLWNFLIKNGATSFNISEDCFFLFNYTFLNYAEGKNYFSRYITKFILESPKNKGDFLNFDNCMDLGINSKFQDDNLSFTIEPVFIMNIYDSKEYKHFLKNNSLFEKLYYIYNYCFPYGIKKGSGSKEDSMCSDNDYNQIIKFISHLYLDINITYINSMSLTKEEIKVNNSEKRIGIISLFIIVLPIIIKIILIISKKVIIYKKKNSSLSKLLIILNNNLNFIKNGKELFNFNIGNTNFNNVSGITYLKGLIGLSIILTIFGQTFFILINYPMKEFGAYKYYNFVDNILYTIVFIGFRYSPRILFSCSGYTLIYKYLSFIEQGQGYYFIKFFIRQSYKYLLSFIFIIMLKFSLHNVIFLLRDAKRPALFLYQKFMENHDLIKKFLTLLLSFSFNGSKSNSNQSVIYFYYIPINEIFFFIFGTILISFCYKYKLRLDVIIIYIFVILYIIKIFVYIFYFLPEEKMYTTTGYYLFDYGLALVNPLFNLPSFIIGMFFGLTNYCVQKGITSLYRENNNYKLFHLLNDEFNKNIINNIKDDGSDSNKNINNNKDIKEIDNKKIEDYLSADNEKNGEKVYSERIKKMPFLIWPIIFLNFNKRNKDRLLFNIIIILSFILLIIFISAKIIYLAVSPDLYSNKDVKSFIKQLSLENLITNIGFNILYLIDIELAVFIVQFGIFILFFKEYEVFRNFFNHIYWSFLVKSYFSFILISIPLILFIFYGNESVVRLSIYNIIFFSVINFNIIFVAIIIFYSCFDLPFKKIFKYFINGNDIIDQDEEDEDKDSNDDNNDKQEYEDDRILIDMDDKDEIQSFKYKL